MQTHFLILLSEIPVYGVMTHADKQGSNDRQTQFKNHLGLINTRFKCIANYCTDFDPNESYISTTLPQLDIPVLQLMTQVSFSIVSVPDEGYSKNASPALNLISTSSLQPVTHLSKGSLFQSMFYWLDRYCYRYHLSLSSHYHRCTV